MASRRGSGRGAAPQHVVGQRSQRRECRSDFGVVGAKLHAVLLLDHEGDFEGIDRIETDAVGATAEEGGRRNDCVGGDMLETEYFHEALRHERFIRRLSGHGCFNLHLQRNSLYSRTTKLMTIEAAGEGAGQCRERAANSIMRGEYSRLDSFSCCSERARSSSPDHVPCEAVDLKAYRAPPHPRGSMPFWVYMEILRIIGI